VHPEIASYLQVPQLLTCIYWCTCRQLGPCTHLMHHMSDPSDMCMISILTKDMFSNISVLISSLWMHGLYGWRHVVYVSTCSISQYMWYMAVYVVYGSTCGIYQYV